MLHYFRKRLANAIKAFQEYPDIEFDEKKSAIQSLVTREDLETFYQPIMELRSKQILGFEALNRPDEASVFSNASELFSFAEQNEMIYDLDLKCRELAIKRTTQNMNNRMLFINVNANVLMAASQHEDPFKNLLQQTGLKLPNIVMEITERQAIKDFALFNTLLDDYRGKGFKIAVDDLGAGYSSLQTIAELKPDYIKLDMSLVREINTIDFKKILVETIVQFSDKSNSLLIAEGIENKEEFDVLTDLGVQYGQGYFIEKPKYPEEIAC